MSFDQLSNLETGSRRGHGHDGFSDSPEFTRLSQGLMTTLFHLQANNTKLHTEIERLGTRHDNPRLRERVQTLLEESRDKFKDVGQGVKKLQSDFGDDLTPTQKYSQQKLGREFGASLKTFQALQRTALEKQKASITAARAALDQDGHATEHAEQGGQPGDLLQLQAQQEQIHMAPQDEVDFQDALIREREEEIRQIEEGVGDLNVLFRQVAQIVSEQGEQLETIEGNAVDIREDTRGADYELRAASRHQKAARGKACCLLMILAVIMTIVLLAVFLG